MPLRASLTAVIFLVFVSTSWAQDRNLQVAKADAGGERRIALVIGNSAYKSSPLKNPVNDARAIAGALKQAGFEVTLKEDLNQRGLFEAAREFGNKLKEDGVALFYYAGHGMQVRDRNYLVPVEADIQSELEVPYSSLDVNFVMDLMNRARSRMNLVILDACRNNPFSRSFRSAAVGLAQMDAPGGTLLAYATAPGKVASDGSGDNGLYTQYLLKHLPTPGLPVEIVFKRVREDVEKETKSQQVPWESSSVKGDFYFVPPKPVAQVALAAPAPVIPAVDTAAQTELAFWDSIKGSSAAADYQAYLATYPAGRFAALARARIASIEQQGAAVADSREMAFWDSIKGSSNPAEYQAYLDQYPKGRFAALARARIEQAKQNAAAASAAAAAAARPPAPAPAPTAPAFSAESLDLAFWNSIQGTRIADDYRAYLRQYPNGRFAELAKLRVEQLSAPPPASAAPATTAPARPAAPAAQVASAAPTAAIAGAAQPAAPVAIPTGLKVKNPALLPQPGDTWTYRYTDPLNPTGQGDLVYQVTGLSAEGVEEGFRRASVRTLQSRVVVEPGLRWTSHSGQNFISPDFAAYVLAYGDLEEGKPTRVQVPASRYGASGGEVIVFDVTPKGEESVTVPAGTFKARRVEIRGSTPALGFGSGVRNLAIRVDVWYAPEVKRMVRYLSEADAGTGGRVDNSKFELVSYKVSNAVAAGVVASAPVAAPAPAVQVASAAPTTAIAAGASKLPVANERWVYQYTDLWSPGVKVRVTHTVAVVEKGEIVETLVRAGRRGDERELSMKPVLGLQPMGVEGISMLQLFPYAWSMDLLKPGQKAVIADMQQSLCGVAGSNWIASAEVEGEEEVTTPAGKFRAWKVLVTGNAPRGQIGQLCHQFVARAWFAPEIKRYVKATFNTTTVGRGGTEYRDMYELVEAPR